MKALRLILPAATLAAVLLSTASMSFGTPAFGKKEAKPCTTCHEKGKATKENPMLNATGKHYKAKKTLDGAPK